MDESGLFLTLEIDRGSGRLLRIIPSAQTDEEFEVAKKAIYRIFPPDGGWFQRLIRLAGRG